MLFLINPIDLQTHCELSFFGFPYRHDFKDIFSVKQRFHTQDCSSTERELGNSDLAAEGK